MFKNFKKSQNGFTLIEILVVMGIIAVLAAIVVIAINPARQFAQARNTQRSSDINTILNAIGQNVADNKGTLTCASIVTAIPVSPTAANDIGTGGVADVNLSCLTPTYIAGGVPMDPSGGTAGDTKYTIQQDTVANGSRYIVCAPNSAETAIVPTPAVLCVTR